MAAESIASTDEKSLKIYEEVVAKYYRDDIHFRLKYTVLKNKYEKAMSNLLTDSSDRDASIADFGSHILTPDE